MSSVGEIIKACRKQTGLTQRSLARRAGIPASTLCRWERGMFTPNVTDFRRVLLVCGYDIQIVRTKK